MTNDSTHPFKRRDYENYPLSGVELEAWAMILCEDEDPSDLTALGMTVLTEFRRWQGLPYSSIEPTHHSEMAYRAICWFDEHNRIA